MWHLVERIGGGCLAAAVVVVAMAAPGSVAAGRRTHVARAASGGPTGNPATIAFARKVVAATRRMGTEDLFLRGSYTVVKRTTATLAWYTDGTPPRAGYMPAADDITVAASHGRVTFVVDAVTGAGGRGFPPFGMLLTATGEYLLAGGASVSYTPPTKAFVQPCAGRDTGRPLVGGYTKVGVPSGYRLYGHFAPMRRSGANEIVTSTFAWDATQVATEVDTISATTHLPSALRVRVSAAKGHPAFSFSGRVSWRLATPYPPNSNGICRQPGTPG